VVRVEELEKRNMYPKTITWGNIAFGGKACTTSRGENLERGFLRELSMPGEKKVARFWEKSVQV